jgi:hypothetical protein
MFTSRVTGKEKGWPASEIVEQINLIRAEAAARGSTAGEPSGHIHFSMKALMENTGGIADALKELYREPALPPTSATNRRQ